VYFRFLSVLIIWCDMNYYLLILAVVGLCPNCAVNVQGIGVFDYPVISQFVKESPNFMELPCHIKIPLLGVYPERIQSSTQLHIKINFKFSYLN
jgi:hypothetical protein